MIEKVNISTHLRADRLDRVAYIATTIGFGEVKYIRYSPETERNICLTNTGVIIVKDKNDTIITMYIAEYKQANYVTYSKTPQWLSNVIKKNLQHKHHILQNCTSY